MSRKAQPKTKPGTKTPASGGSSKFWPGLIVGGALAAAAVHFGPAWYKEWAVASPGEKRDPNATNPKAKNAISTNSRGTGTSAKTQKVPPDKTPSPAPASAVSAKAVGVPAYFMDPARAANLLTRLGLGESYPGSLLWKNTDALGWNAFGVLATSGSPVSTSTAAAGNSVTCLLESKRADRVEALRLMANVYQSRDGEATLAKFKTFAQSILQETRCPGTREFLEAIDGRLSLQTASTDARYTLSQSALAPGTRWELTVEAR